MNLKNSKQLINMYVEPLKYDLKYLDLLDDNIINLRLKSNIKYFIKSLNILVHDKFKVDLSISWYITFEDILRKPKSFFELQKYIIINYRENVKKHNNNMPSKENLLNPKDYKLLDIQEVSNFIMKILNCNINISNWKY